MIRPARLDEIETIAAVERLSWPLGMATNAKALAARIEAFPAGQLVEEIEGEVVGYVAAQRISNARLLDEALTFAQLTDHGRFTHSHEPNGDVYQLIGVGVLPTERGSGLARALVDRQIEQARRLPGVRRIVGFTRPAHYERHSDQSIESYVIARNEQGQLVDPVLGFHLNAGAKLVSIHAHFRPEDTAALGYGLLIEYPLEVV